MKVTVDYRDQFSSATLRSTISTAQTLLLDLLSQTVNLIVSLQKEIKVIEEDRVKPLKRGSRGSPITVRSLKSSIILLQFSTLEALANIMAELTVRAHAGLEGFPTLPKPLSQVELDLLQEQRSLVEPTSGNIKVQKGAYVSTLDKLSIAPLLFTKSQGKDFRLNRGADGWEKARKLKGLRDALTHVRLGIEPSPVMIPGQLDLNTVRPSIQISGNDLFDGSESILWYCRELMRACAEVTGTEYFEMGIVLKFAEFVAYMHLINLRDGGNISDDRMNKLTPRNISMTSESSSP